MRKTERVLSIERQHGKPIEQIVAEAYNRAGSVRAAAAELGVNHNTFYGWVLSLGIRIKSVAEAPGAAA